MNSCILIEGFFDGDCGKILCCCWSIIDCILRCKFILEWSVVCCQGDSGVTGVDAAAIDARKLILSCTARCCLSICVVDVEFCDEGKLNIDKDSLGNNLLTVCCCCCWLNWISASSIEDDVDDEVEDDDWRFVDDTLVVDGFVGANSMKKFYISQYLE